MNKKKQQSSQKRKPKPSKKQTRKKHQLAVKKKKRKQISGSPQDRLKKGAVKQNRKKRKKRLVKRKKKGIIKELAITLSAAILVFLTIFTLTVRIPKVEGYAMIPTINDQDRLFVYKWGEIRRFSLVFFKDPAGDESLIRRVIGLPGEELYYQEGRLFVNGEEIPERFLSTNLAEFSDEPLTEDFSLKEIIETGQVPKDCYFVLGDNRSYATDSRYFGFIKKSEITGVVKARIFPIHAMRQF